MAPRSIPLHLCLSLAETFKTSYLYIIKGEIISEPYQPLTMSFLHVQDATHVYRDGRKNNQPCSDHGGVNTFRFQLQNLCFSPGQKIFRSKLITSYAYDAGAISIKTRDYPPVLPYREAQCFCTNMLRLQASLKVLNEL